MAEDQQIYTFTYKEVAEALVKEKGIREGLWGVYIKFGISGTNIGPNVNDMRPAAIVPILEIGIQKFKEESNLTVDAAIINATP